MRCNNCGYENLDTASFCENCGSKLNNSYNEIENSYSAKKKSNAGKIIAIIVLIGVIIAAGFFFVFNGMKSKEIKKLESSLEVETLNKNYDSMKSLNKELYDITGDKKYLSEIERINSLKESEENLQNTKDSIESNNFEDALLALKDMESAEEVNETEVSNLRTKLMNRLNSQITNNNASGEYRASATLLNNLLSIEPENENFKNLLQSVNDAEAAHNAEVQKQEAEKKAQETKAKQNANKKSLTDIGAGLVGKTIYVSAQTANIRSGPGTEYTNLYTIYKGDGVYVASYTVNSKGILWLNTGDGWVSYKNFDGSLKY